MRPPAEYTFRLDAPPAEVFAAVWRTNLDAPGFALLVPETPLESHFSRRFVVDLATAFTDFGPFAFERLGRFDQQVTTKFHRDGAPPASLLLLAYEPTTVPSRLFVADAEAAARQAGIGVNAFLAAHNRMFPPGEALLRPFITELVWPREMGALVLVNNSLFPDDTPGEVPRGVLHKGEIVHPDSTARRVINSAGLSPVESGRTLPAYAIERFLSRKDLD